MAPTVTPVNVNVTDTNQKATIYFDNKEIRNAVIKPLEDGTYEITSKNYDELISAAKGGNNRTVVEFQDLTPEQKVAFFGGTDLANEYEVTVSTNSNNEKCYTITVKEDAKEWTWRGFKSGMKYPTLKGIKDTFGISDKAIIEALGEEELKRQLPDGTALPIKGGEIDYDQVRTAEKFTFTVRVEDMKWNEEKF